MVVLVNYIKGKFRQTIYRSDSGYTVGLFRITETNDPEMEAFLKKSVTFTGYFTELMKIIYYMEI